MQDIKTQDKGTVEVCSDDFQEIHKDTKPCACDHDIKTRPCTCAQDAHPVVKRAWKPAPVSKMPRFPSEKVTKKPKAEQEKGETVNPNQINICQVLRNSEECWTILT